MSLIKQLLGESAATSFHPDRAAAFVAEFKAGKRILVLTATQAELMQSREELRRRRGELKGAFVAFSLRDLVSASYDTESAENADSEADLPPARDVMPG